MQLVVAVALMQLLTFCCVHRSSDSQCFTMGPKLRLALGDLNHHDHLIHGALGLSESILDPVGILIASDVFAGLTNVTNRQINRHRQTTLLCPKQKAAFSYCCSAVKQYFATHE